MLRLRIAEGGEQQALTGSGDLCDLLAQAVQLTLARDQAQRKQGQSGETDEAERDRDLGTQARGGELSRGQREAARARARKTRRGRGVVNGPRTLGDRHHRLRREAVGEGVFDPVGRTPFPPGERLDVFAVVEEAVHARADVDFLAGIAEQ